MNATVPVSCTDQSAAISTSISPPGICTVTGLAQRPVRMAAPTAAHDEVPEASVYAAPRSPDFDAHGVRIHHLGELDVRAVGVERQVFERRT